MPISPPQRNASAQGSATHALRRRILSGELPPGARLPPERVLAPQLGISRLTLRAVLASLSSEGLVRGHRGSGVEVLDFRENAHVDMVAWLLSQIGSPPERVAELFAEVIRARRVLAVDVLVSAAERVQSADLVDLQALVAAQRERLSEPRAYLAGDESYQRRIVRIAGSTVFELLFNSFQKAAWQVPELILAFMGPLEIHWQTYALIDGLLREPDANALRPMAEEFLARLEREGLERVRAACGAPWIP